MPQRYVLPDQGAAEREFLPAKAWWKFSRRFNVAPTQYVPAVRLHEGASEGVMLRWGLIPAWLEGDIRGPPRARVAIDRLEHSASCRKPWSDGQRCILPAAGFYAWQSTEAGHRQPYFVWLTDRAAFGFAAIWDRWVSDDDDVIESCAIVSVAANELLADGGPSRPGMPAILRRRDYELWLQGSPAAAREVLQPFQAGLMHAHPVSPRINSSAEDDPALIRAAS